MIFIDNLFLLESMIQKSRLPHAARRHEDDIVAVGQLPNQFRGLLFPVAEVFGAFITRSHKWILQHICSVFALQKYYFFQYYVFCVTVFA